MPLAEAEAKEAMKKYASHWLIFFAKGEEGLHGLFPFFNTASNTRSKRGIAKHALVSTEQRNSLSQHYCRNIPVATVLRGLLSLFSLIDKVQNVLYNQKMKQSARLLRF